MEHALLFCDWTRPLWFGNQLQQVADRSTTTNLGNWLEQSVSKLPSNLEFKDYAFISIVCAMWIIWKGRNLHRFEGVLPNPKSLMHQIVSLQSELTSRATGPPEIRGRQNNDDTTGKYWRSPIPGCVKVNVDASFIKDKGVGCSSLIVRNCK